MLALIGAIWFFFSASRLEKRNTSLHGIAQRSTQVASRAQAQLKTLKDQLKQAQLKQDQIELAQSAQAPQEENAAKQEFDYGTHLEASLLLNEERINQLGGETGQMLDASNSLDLNAVLLRNTYLNAELNAHYEKDDVLAFWNTLSEQLTRALLSLAPGEPIEQSHPDHEHNPSEQPPAEPVAPEHYAELNKQLADAEQTIETLKHQWNEEHTRVTQAYRSLFETTQTPELTEAHQQLNLIYTANINAVKHIAGLKLPNLSSNELSMETVGPDGQPALEATQVPSSMSAQDAPAFTDTEQLPTEDENKQDAPKHDAPIISESDKLDGFDAMGETAVELDPIVGAESEAPLNPEFPSEEIRHMIDTGPQEETQAEERGTSDIQEPTDQPISSPELTAAVDPPAISEPQPTEAPPDERQLDQASQDLLDELFKDT